MSQKNSLILGMLALASLTACMGSYVYTAEQSHLCKIEQANGWGADRKIKIEDVTYVFDVHDTGSANDISGPVSDVFWVAVSGLTVGRAVGWRAPAMIYDPSEAVIEIKGKKINALSRAWTNELVNGHWLPTKEIPVPFDLNAPSRKTPLGFYIAFPMKAPDARDEYFFSPGTVLLDGKRTLLPTRRSCYTPAHSRWVPIH